MTLVENRNILIFKRSAPFIKYVPIRFLCIAYVSIPLTILAIKCG